jgi:hypothetical protein
LRPVNSIGAAPRQALWVIRAGSGEEAKERQVRERRTLDHHTRVGVGDAELIR